MKTVNCDVCNKQITDLTDVFNVEVHSTEPEQLVIIPTLLGINDVCIDCIKEIDMAVSDIIIDKEQRRKYDENGMD